MHGKQYLTNLTNSSHFYSIASKTKTKEGWPSGRELTPWSTQSLWPAPQSQVAPRASHSSHSHLTMHRGCRPKVETMQGPWGHRAVAFLGSKGRLLTGLDRCRLMASSSSIMVVWQQRQERTWERSWRRTSSTRKSLNRSTKNWTSKAVQTMWALEEPCHATQLLNLRKAQQPHQYRILGHNSARVFSMAQRSHQQMLQMLRAWWPVVEEVSSWAPSAIKKRCHLKCVTRA